MVNVPPTHGTDRDPLLGVCPVTAAAGCGAGEGTRTPGLLITSHPGVCAVLTRRDPLNLRDARERCAPNNQARASADSTDSARAHWYCRACAAAISDRTRSGSSATTTSTPAWRSASARHVPDWNGDAASSSANRAMSRGFVPS